MQRQLAVVLSTLLILGAFVGIIQQQVAADLNAAGAGTTTELVATRADDRVDFSWTLTHDGDGTLALEYGYANIDFIVRQDGDEVWRWTDDRVFIMILLTAELKPGDSLKLTGYWEDPAPGSYTVEATFNPSSGPSFRAEPVPFTVE